MIFWSEKSQGHTLDNEKKKAKEKSGPRLSPPLVPHSAASPPQCHPGVHILARDMTCSNMAADFCYFAEEIGKIVHHLAN